jgi:hypothetical protein
VVDAQTLMNLGHEAATQMHLLKPALYAVASAAEAEGVDLDATEFNVVVIIAKSVFTEQLLHAYYYSNTVTPIDGLN